MFHNMNPRVTKCPNCKAPLYKTEGCNHMTCYRCSKDWCWICHRVTNEGYGKHFEEGAIFGCPGMKGLPQSVCLYIFYTTLLLLMSPFVLIFKFSGMLGKCSKFRFRDESTLPGAVFFFGILLAPIVLVPTLIALPVVFIYRAYILFGIIARHFICCCC